LATRYQFVDDSGKTRLAGFLVPEPGGSSPVTRELILGNPVAIANGANGVLTWDSVVQGDTLIDISDPAAPTVIAAGVYGFFVYVIPGSNMTVGGVVRLKLSVDLNGDDYETDALPSGPAATAQLKPAAVVPLTWYSPAGGLLEARAYNQDGVQDLSFVLHAYVQRIS